MAAAGILLATLSSEVVDVAYAQQAPQGPLPPVTIEPAKSQADRQGQSAAAKPTNASKKKKRAAHRAAPPSPAAGGPAQAGAGGVHNAATNPNYNSGIVNLGPLGNRSLLDTPLSMTVISNDMLQNLQPKTVNDALRYLPDVEIRNQQGYEVSRPQSRGFQGTVVQNTRLDGLSVIGTTAIPAENLSGIQVLNGLAGSLYGPATPAGVFNYVLKRPTDTPYASYTQGFDSTSVFTENVDVGGRTPDGKVGYRFNVVHGEGESWAPESASNRTLASSALDFYLGDRTVIETNLSHYETNTTGLPGSITYFSKTNILLPAAVDPTKLGLGQPGAGTDLITNTGLVKLKHEFNNDWNFEIGGLYQDAVRNLFGITDSMTDNNGDYTVTKNFNAVPHFTIASNTASLNGKFDLFGFRNEVTIGTNGFFNGQYSYRNSIAINNYGASNLADPTVFANPPTPNNGGQFKSAILQNQTIVTGDTFHFNDQWAVQSVVSTSFLHSESWAATGAVTSQQSADGVVSPTVSLIYKPFDKITTYATWANSVEQSDQAAAGTVNVNQFLAPYTDQEYEVGVKYAVTPRLLATFALFHMTRPFAETNAVTNIFQVVGTQRNNGAELFLQGDIYSDLTVFGGISYIDARLLDTGVASTNGRLVVGVPLFKTDMLADYHPAIWQGFALTGGVHAEGERAATNFNNSFAPSYATFDAGIRFTKTVDKHIVTARFQVLNIGNTFYYSSIADGNIVGSPGANTAYLGTPRTYMLSLQMTL
ncbi:MAG: TonB-dependent receptor [Bradyrhizobium sp.]|uniref:TonB-dependent receptor n=1 Tax=Bradyrhizobium sp. TaxID=376 RepID=UPI003BD8A251